jgi:O-antigen/teichoic acid export membrane protein
MQKNNRCVAIEYNAYVFEKNKKMDKNKYIADLIKKLKQSALFKDSLWALIGGVLSNALSLIAGIAVARFLGKNVFGEYGMIKTTLIEIAILSTFGFGYTTTKYIAQYKKEQPNKILQLVHYSTNITLVISCIIAFLVLIFANQLAIFLKVEHISTMLRLSAIAIIFNAINTTYTGILSGFTAFKTIAVNKFISGIVIFVLSVTLTYFYGLEGAIVALTISLLFNTIINYFSVQKILTYYPKGQQKDKQLNKEMIKFSLPIALRESSFTIVYWLTAFFIVRLSNYGELGIYNAAIQWMGIVSFLPSVLNNVMLSYFSESANDTDRHRKIVKSMLITAGLSTFIPFLLILIFVDFISSLYGSTFIGMSSVLVIAMFTGVITAITGVYNQEFIALGKNWFLFITRFFRDSLGIVMAIFLIRYINLQSSAALLFAVSMVSIYSIYCLILHITYRKSIKQ